MIGKTNAASRNRPIDRIRDGAGSAEIPPGHGNIVSMKVIGPRMYFLTERGLTSGVMADQIDPERRNQNIPNVVQRVELPYGVESVFMQKTVCVAFELIDQTYLPTHVDNDEVLTIAVAIALSLASVTEFVCQLQAHQRHTRAEGKAGRLSAAYVPHTANLDGKVRQSIAALREVEVAIKKTTAHFYPKDMSNHRWDKKLKDALLAKHAQTDGFIDHVNSLWTAMDNVANHRNAMIHPNEEKSIKINDYELDPAGVFIAPTIEILHPRSPVARRDTAQFLEMQVDSIANVYQCLLGYMCDMNVRLLGEMIQSEVTTLPDGGMRNGSKLVWTSNFAQPVTS